MRNGGSNRVDLVSCAYRLACATKIRHRVGVRESHGEFLHAAKIRADFSANRNSNGWRWTLVSVSNLLAFAALLLRMLFPLRAARIRSMNPEIPASLPDDAGARPTERGVESVGQEFSPRLPFPVVGIGASAGGLEAFMGFFDVMPNDSGMAFVLVQHLPPERESLVAEIVAKHTGMPVLQVSNGLPVHPNHVYVIRPGRTLTIREGALHLGDPLEQPGHRRPVDDFFRSLAEEQRERAIAIILSGMGSNGSAGAQQVKAVGGVCIAQDPETAKFPSMPRSLIEIGQADFILKVEEMPAHLLRYCQHPYARGELGKAEEPRNRAVMAEILSILRARTRLDFSGYKKPTVLRRVQRRMGLHEVTDLAEYARMLRQNAAEATALSDDLMIHVTGFFRDPEVWEALREKVIEPLVAERVAESSIRAWVTACSSGEEAYTLAMLLIEAAEAAGKTFDFKIFATDTAERSLSLARAGIYPGGIESEISRARLDRFFDRNDAVYRIKKTLREMVVFAPQNLLQDPPFSRLDLCTCRNLLIYLENDVQQRALAMMHFGLREGGTLLLGTSETMSGWEDTYEVVDKKHRIFRRSGPVRQNVLEFARAPAFLPRGEADQHKPHPLSRASFMQLTQRSLLETFSPAAVVIDRQQRIVYFHGRTELYLDQPRGEPTRELGVLAREFVRIAVRSAVQRALAEEAPVRVRDGIRETPSGRWRITVGIRPLEAARPVSHFLVTFEEQREDELAPSGEASSVAGHHDLEQELQRTKDELQHTVEDLQSSNEELKASNEEATSVNEELQSINEELETSKEELQSLNEELTTVNTQLQAKMHELEGTTNDLSSLLSSTKIAVIFLDLNFRIRRFTPAVQEFFDLIMSDVGRPLRDLARKFADPELLSDAQESLERLEPRGREIAGESGRIYLRRTLPYQTTDHRITGVVITFIDVGDQKIAEAELRRNEIRSRVILDGVLEYAIFLVDGDGRIATWPKGAERVLGYSPVEAIGQPLALISTEEDAVLHTTEKSVAAAAAGERVAGDRWYRRKDRTRFFGTGTLYALKDGSVLTGYVQVLRDNTDLRRAEETLTAKRVAEEANTAKDYFLANVSHELRTPLSAMLLWTKLLREQENVTPAMAEGLAAIEKCAIEQQTLIEDIVDTSRIVAGKLRLERKPVDLTVVVKSAVDAIRPGLAEKKMILTERYGPGVGLVSADSNRLYQVVGNLLTNAVKFTPSGGAISVRLERKEDEIEFEVRDSGRGIAPDLLPRIFERFLQGEATTTRSHSGLGLGLSIVRQLVELHGGTVAAESEGADQGTRMLVRLPLPALDPASASRGSASPVNGKVDLAGLRVHVIEDAPETRQALAVFLQRAGAEVTISETARVALEKLRVDRPDVLLSDLGLPEIDGHELIRQVREWEQTRGLPPLTAFALTAYADEANQRKALTSGFQRCLTKPVDAPKLLGILARLPRSQ